MTEIVEFEKDIVSGLEQILWDGEILLVYPAGRHEIYHQRPPKLTVCVPVFNGGRNLRRCLESIVQQDYQDFFLVIVDNCSTDGSFALACEFATNYGNVIVYQNAGNIGRVQNWNRCLALAAGEYVKLVMTNDFLRPGHLSRLAKILDENPNLSVVRGSLVLLHPDGQLQFGPLFPASRYFTGKEALEYCLRNGNIGAGPTAQMWRGRLIREHRLRFNPEYSWAADFDFFLQLLQYGDFYYHREPLYVFDASSGRFYSRSNPVLQFREECLVPIRALKAWPNGASLKPVLRQKVETLYQKFRQGVTDETARELEATYHAVLKELEGKEPPSESASDEKEPLVSVIIPCYNQAHYLPEAVKSVLEQTYSRWECIIVDDGSTDDTAKVAEAIIRAHPDKKIRLIRQENGGLARARNRGIQEARGKYILPLDADDQIHPEMLRKTVELLERHPEIHIAYTDVYRFEHDNQVVASGVFDVNILKKRNQLNYCSLYRKEVWEAAGGYNPNMIYGYEDWDFWITCAEKGFKGKRIPEPLFRYRVRKSSMFTDAQEHDAELRAQIILNHPDLYRPEEVKMAEHILATARKRKTATDAGPLVSVIIPTFNRPEFLKRAVKSVLAQTFQDFEIIVVNDGGDPVEHVFHGLEGSEKIQYVRLAQNRGVAAARNTGLRIARGKYIAYLDDDDEFYPNHLEVLVDTIEWTSEKVVYSDAHRILERKIGREWKEVDRRVLYSNDFSRDLLLLQNIAPIQSFLHDRSCLDEVGYFDESLSTHEDWEFWLRMSRRFVFRHIRQVTSAFRQRIAGDNMTMTRLPDFYATTRILYSRYPLEPGKTDLERKRQQRLAFLMNEIQKAERKPDVSVIIVTYNSESTLQNCLGSLLPTLKDTDEVILIDNASRDRTREIIEQFARQYIQIRTVLNRKNKGFSAAVNQGIRTSRNPVIILLNPDVYVTRNWLPKLLAHFDEKTGAVGPISNYAAGKQNWRHYVSELGNREIGVEELDSYLEQRYRGQSEETKLLTGFCMAIRREAIEKVGMLDEALFLGNDDLDFSLRLREAGFILKVAKDTFVYHEGQKSFQSLGDAEKRRRMQESLDRFYRKLEKKYGEGKVPPSLELWGIDILGIPSKFLRGRHVVPLYPSEKETVDPSLRVAIVYDNRVRPDTTGEYCRKALSRICQVRHFLPEEAMALEPGSFDLYLFIDDGLDYPIPYWLRPNAWWVIDTHLNYEKDLQKAHLFDVVFAAQKDGAARLKRDGIRHVFWLPLAADPEIHTPKKKTTPVYDVAFVGNVFPGVREQLLQLIQKNFKNVFVGKADHRKMADIYGSARIAFNISLRNDINMRVFEGLCSGALLVTNDLSDNGMRDLFDVGRELITYRSAEEMLEKIRYYLEHERERKAIARCGREKILQRHTYLHRTQALLQTWQRVLRTASGERPDKLASIILVTRNGLEVTRRCIESVRRHTSRPYELIVVDNGSVDGTVEYLEAQPDVRLIRNKENRGFAAANNQGIRASRGDYIVLLNNDTVVTPGWLDGLLRGFELSPRVGIVGPLTNRVGSDYQRWPMNEKEDLLSFSSKIRQQNRNQFVIVGKLVAFCWVMRRELVDRIGLLDEEFELGNFEDDDYCVRARLAGYDLIVAREVFVYHEGSYSFQKNQVDYLKYLNKNLQRFKQKWKGEIEFRGEHYFFKRDLKRIALQEISNGEKAFARNEIDKAATHFQKALEWDPESAQALNNLGVVHFLKGNYGKARECLLKAIDLDKTYEDAWRNFLSLPPEQESWKKLAFRAAKISWNKEMVATLFGFARTAWEMGWENVARAFGDAVREGDADSVEARLLGVLERWYGQDAAGALNLLDQISRAAPNHPEVIRLYAQFSALLGNADDAVQLLEEFLRQQPHPELESLLNEIKRLPARQAVEEGVDFHE